MLEVEIQGVEIDFMGDFDLCLTEYIQLFVKINK